MTTLEVTLKSWSNAIVRLITGEGSYNIEYIPRDESGELTIKATDAVNTVSVPEYAVHEYKSIVPLEGKYADDPSWEHFDDFIENYWREIDARGGE